MAASDDSETEPYREGKAAAERSEPASRNPYAPRTEDHAHWLRGYRSVTAPDEIADDTADFA